MIKIMKLYRAYVDTRHFDFEGYGYTKEEACKACYDVWLDHCRQCPGELFADPSLVGLEDISVYPIKVGSAYRDREEIKA